MKTLIAVLLILLAIPPLYAQRSSDLPEPPSNEPTPLFNFEIFERQPAVPQHVYEHIRSLENKKRTNWNAKDSLYYAVELSLLEAFENSLNYFVRLKIDTIANRFVLATIQRTFRETNRFSRLIENLEQELTYYPEHSESINLRIEIASARLRHKEEHLRVVDLTVFESLQPWLLDTLFKENKPKSRLAINKARNLDKALRREILFSDKTDRILSLAFTEFGDFLKMYLYKSNAYIAYSIARDFDKRNSNAFKNIKETKDYFNNNNYLYPSVVSVFKNINPDKYSFQTYKEIDSLDIIIKERGRFPDLDELLAQSDIRKDHLPWLDLEKAFLFILILILVFAIFFVRTE